MSNEKENYYGGKSEYQETTISNSPVI